MNFASDTGWIAIYVHIPRGKQCNRDKKSDMWGVTRWEDSEEQVV